MAISKVKTTIVNRTKYPVVLRVGHQNCFAKLATIEVGGKHTIEIDVHWTYQEFALEPVTSGATALMKIIVNSDDCCDYERLTVTESGGKFQVDKVARAHFNYGTDGRHPEVRRGWESYFTWLSNWPKFNWRFWLR